MVLRLTCLASAMVAISAASTAAAQTPSTPQPVQQPPATAPASTQDVMLKARILREDRNTGVIVAEGDVEVRAGARVLRADKLTYDTNSKSMRAQGRVEIVDEDGSIQYSDEIEVDDGFRNGFATRFSARLTGNAIATASSAIRQDGTRNSLEQVVYTGCPVCEEGGEPTWSLRARRAVLNQETDMISYQDAVLEIKGVPVLYIPYFAHPDPSSGKRSGLLPPDLGLSSKLGAFYEQPYYWVIDPSQDLTISPMIAANVAPLIKMNYRKRFFSGYLEADGSFTYEKDFDSDGEKFGERTLRSHLYGLGVFDINQNWRWGFGVERQTDDLYDQRYDLDGEDDLRGLYASQPRQLLSQLYTTGQHEDFYLEAGLLMFQGLRAFDNDAQFPRVAPTIYAEKVFDLGKQGQLSAEFSSVALFRDEQQRLPNGQFALDTARATTVLDWGAQYVMGPGLVVTPFASGRGDAYRINDGVTDERVESRFLGLGGAQVSWPLMRSGDKVDLLIEPIAMVAYGTEGANDAGIPNEDSLVFEADETNLFRPNAVSNYDLWEGGGRAALGLSATARIGDDYEISGVVGRRWRAEADPAFNDLSNLSEKKSDYVASVRAELGKNFSAGARMRFEDDLSLNRIDVDANANIWRINGNARYFKVARNAAGLEDEAIALNGSFRVTDRWSAILQQHRNITDGRDLRMSVGVAYQDECSFFAISYERSGGVDRTLGPSESIRFQFVLTGLGGR